MSSPLDFNDSDDAMEGQQQGSQQQQQTPSRSAIRRQLFNTPSDVAQARTPMSNLVARRALAGGVTPRRPVPNNNAPSSSPMQWPSSSPARPTAPQPNFDANASEDAMMTDAPAVRPLFHPSSPAASTPRKNRVRGDVNPSALTSPFHHNVGVAGGGAGGASDHPDGAVLPSGLSALPPSEGPDVTRVLWGTTVNVAEALTSFKEFLTDYKVKYRQLYDRQNGVVHQAQMDWQTEDHLQYRAYLKTMILTQQTTLNVDMTNLLAYPRTRRNFYPWLIKYPQEMIPIMDIALGQAIEAIIEDLRETEEIEEAHEKWVHEVSFRVRPFAGDIEVNMRDLNPADTDRLVSIKGLVIRATPIIPDMKVGFFRCLTCSHTMQVEIDQGRITEPARCPRDQCNSLGSMSLIHNRCEFSDKQIIRLQETPDAVPDGQTPHTVSLGVYDELVDLSKPGDRLTITGIFRSIPVRVNPRQRTIRALFKTYIDVVHIKRGDGKRMGFDPSTRQDSTVTTSHIGVGGEAEDEDDPNRLLEGAEAGVTKQQALEMELRELSQRPDIYELLARSLAPSIWEMDDVKKGVLLQMFGGTNKSISKGGGGGGPRYRGDINVLLVGDPGTSKSQILQYVHKIAPRGVYTSGKGSSAVGLTAYVTRDPDSKQLVLESGALVLSDGGVCCIDEFDKMADATRSVLHEVMEQQTVSIAKAGIITTLNARTSILAAANPVGSKYNVNWPITRNIDLPPTLISRFDLLYLVLDKIDTNLDTRLARHLVSLYIEDAPHSAAQDILEIEKLTAYITYGRSKIHPQISDIAAQELVACYVDMRSMGEDSRQKERRITATTRQLESLIRLSEAHARMRFSEFVELEDVQEANRLMREAIRMSATDPNTGLIDLDLINTGAGQQERRLKGDLKREVMRVLEAAGGKAGMRWTEAAKQLQAQSSVRVEATEFTEAVRALEAEGLVKVVGEREKRVIRKIMVD